MSGHDNQSQAGVLQVKKYSPKTILQILFILYSDLFLFGQD